MNTRVGGTKRSSWLTFRRRLILVRLLLRGPLCSSDLISGVYRELGNDGYPDAAASALKHDFDALKSEYGCVIRFNRSTKCYGLEDLGDLALLDLPDRCMEALAFLESSFPPGTGLPEHAGLRELLERVLLLLPAARQETHQRQRSALELQLMGQAPGKIDPEVMAIVKRAVTRKQELRFSYLGTYDDTARQHRVAPYRIYFRTEGHGYLDATLLEASPQGREPRNAAIDYRLDRIVPGSIRLLPQMLPPYRIAPPTYHLSYRLAPTVALRRDVATYFPETIITYHDDGSATVVATITNLWQARQTLLRYGAGCVVLEPPELVALFRETAQGLADAYDVRGEE